MALEMKQEIVTFTDGSDMVVMRNAGMTDAQWEDTRRYMQSNQEESQMLEEYASNPDKMRKEMLIKAMTEVWQKQQNEGDDEFSNKIKAVEEDPEFEQLFSDLKAFDSTGVMMHYDDDALMMKVSKKMGGIPREVKPTLEKIRKTPITLQEACKFGDIKQLQKYLSETEADVSMRDIDAKDHKGITCLGYAIGANRMAIAKLLIESRADPSAVDLQGNNGLHYAAGYGRKDLLEYLLGLGLEVNKKNSRGLTPLACAKKNGRTEAAEILAKSKGVE